MAHLRHDSSYFWCWYEVSTLWIKSMKNLKLIVKDFIKVCYRSAIFAFLNDYNNKVLYILAVFNYYKILIIIVSKTRF